MDRRHREVRPQSGQGSFRCVKATPHPAIFAICILPISHSLTSNFRQDDLWLEIARQRQTYAAFEFSPLLSDCRGFLLKLDGRSKTWKKRFCVLCDACLYLYVDKEAHSAIGM